MIIHRKNDKVSVTIDTIEVKISPLTYQQKSELQAHMMKAVNGDMDEAMISVRKALKFCLKDIKGVFYIDDDGEKREYKLEFEDNMLTNDSVDDVLNMPISGKLNSVCAAMLQGVPDAIIDGEGNPIEGIKIKKLGEKVKGKSKVKS